MNDMMIIKKNWYCVLQKKNEYSTYKKWIIKKWRYVYLYIKNIIHKRYLLAI